MKVPPKMIMQILVKLHMAAIEIPQEYWDELLRKISAKLSYQLVSLSLSYDEFKFSKRMIYSEIKIPRRKWLAIPKIEMIEEDKAVDKKAKGGKPPAKGATVKSGVVQEELDQGPKLVPKFIRQMLEMDSYQGYFEEFLLTLHEDYYNFVDYFIEYWSDHINLFSDKIGNDEILDNYKSNLNKTIEFYSLFFDVSGMFAKIQTNFKDSNSFIEYVCKFIKRIME